MKYFIALSALLVSSQVLAALPPYWDHVTRIQAVIGSSELESQLQSNITGVKEQKNMTYEVTTSQCVATVTLKVQPAPEGMIGATQYQVKSIKNVECK